MNKKCIKRVFALYFCFLFVCIISLGSIPVKASAASDDLADYPGYFFVCDYLGINDFYFRDLPADLVGKPFFFGYCTLDPESGENGSSVVVFAESISAQGNVVTVQNPVLYEPVVSNPVSGVTLIDYHFVESVFGSYEFFFFPISSADNIVIYSGFTFESPAEHLVLYEYVPEEEEIFVDPKAIYPKFYDLLQTYIYGKDAVLTGDQTLTLTLMATTACVLLVSLPFVLVWQFLKLFR